MRALLLVALLGFGTAARAADVSPIDRTALGQLLKRAEDTKSDAIVIYQDGKLLGEWHFGAKVRGPIDAMSATKSIVSLAIGRLLETGKLKSLDQPVHELFPEWRQGRKQKITLRHLLNHTSGLQNEKMAGLEIESSPDFVRLALAAELSDEPGAKFSYNNKATNLLAAIVRIASGKPLDAYVRDEIFAPLGIRRFSWDHDRAGNVEGMSGLKIDAQDLARVGLMMLDGGVWKGRRVVSEKWIEESTGAGQPLMPRCGLLWWRQPAFRMLVADDELIDTWRKGGNSEAFIQKVLPLKDKVFTDRKAFFAAIEQAFGGKQGVEEWHDATWRKKNLPDGKALPAPTEAYWADGWLGQYLVVVPSARLVAVRQVRAPSENAEALAKLDMFADFPQSVIALGGR